MSGNHESGAEGRVGAPFERLAAALFEELEGDAMVKHNDSVPGRYSEGPRQIDVSIRRKDLSGVDRMTVIEARDRKRRLDITHIERFIGFLDDIEADHGAMVSRNGFTSRAIAYARNRDIDLYSPYDGATGLLRKVLARPVVWAAATPVLKPTFTHEALAGDVIHGDDRSGFFKNLSNDGGKTRIPILDRFAERWNARLLPHDRDEPVDLVSDRPFTVYVTDADGRTQWRPVRDFVFTYEVQRQYWLGQFKPEGRGLIDPVNRRIIPAPRPSLLARDASWEEVPGPDAGAHAEFYTLEDFVLQPNELSLGPCKITDTSGTVEFPPLSEL